MLEESMLISDYVYIFFMILMMLYLINIIVYIRLSHALSAVITYLWAKKNPFSHVQYMGCIVLNAFYLPFIVPIYSLISERRIPQDDFIGILVGHIIFYFKYVWPKMQTDFLATPVWLQKLFNEYIEKEEKDKKTDDGKKLVDEKVTNEDKTTKESEIKENLNEMPFGDPKDYNSKEDITESSSSLREFEYGNKDEISNSSAISSINASDIITEESLIKDDTMSLSEDVTSSYHEDSSSILKEKFTGEESGEFEEW